MFLQRLSARGGHRVRRCDLRAAVGGVCAGGARDVLRRRREADRVVAAEPTLQDGVGWTCLTCKLRVTTPFCAACGEQRLDPRDLTLAGLGEKLLHAFTSIDARAARSATVLLRASGGLTLAWTSGLRKPYVGPFQLFLIANVFFFALQSLTGDAVLSSPLQSHLQHQDWSELARSLLAQHLAATHISLEQYAPVFDRAVVLNAQSLVVLMALAFAVLPPLVFIRERRPFMTHVAFSFHLYAFLLLLFCAALLLAAASAQIGLGGLERPQRRQRTEPRQLCSVRAVSLSRDWSGLWSGGREAGLADRGTLVGGAGDRLGVSVRDLRHHPLHHVEIHLIEDRA